MKTKLTLCAVLVALNGALSAASASTGAKYFSDADIYRGAGVKLYQVGDVDPRKPNGFRIPAIASAGNGVLISAADVRYMGSDWSDLVAGTKIRKVKISTRVSFDGGRSWSELNILDAAKGQDANDYQTLATDPALVFDHNTNTALMFGLRNNANLNSGLVVNPGDQDANPDGVTNLPQGHKPDFIMFTSKDKGLSWESKSIYDEVIDQVNAKNTTHKYSIVFQGPGGGMVYNNKIYVPIQAWATHVDTGTNNLPDPQKKHFVATSGFMESSDGGKTWKVSSMLIPNVDDKINDNDKTIISSESNIFHYKGKIRLAVRNEAGDAIPSNHKEKLRQVYEYDESTKTWTEVHEDFIPKDVARVETSSHNLTDDVYLVGYTSYYNYNFNNNSSRRKGQYITTNTGIKILLSDQVSEGYTSITSDDNNIYVMYEGKIDLHDIFFKAIDWKHKDYANLNTQILRRSHAINDFQSQLAQTDGYASSVVSTDVANLEVSASRNGFKGGIYIKHDRDLDEDFTDAISYKNTDIALLVGYEAQYSEQAKGNLMFGLMHSIVDYDNNAENSVNSILAGYQLDYDFGSLAYRGAINAAFSENKFDRNNKEGLGKSAEFDSYSISIINELNKGFELQNLGNVTLSAGLNNTFFGHKAFREKGGEGIGEGGKVGANNAAFSSANLESHELFVKGAFESKKFDINSDLQVSFNADVKYAYDLADSDKWFETYRTMSVDRKYHDIGELYAARDGGYLKAKAGVDLTIYKDLALGLTGSIDSIGDLNGGFKLSYKF